jgi:5-methylcytosine-specific restriction protein A
MPTRPARICSCGKRVPSGILCECQKARAAERKARFDATRPSARERGYTSKWEKERAAFLALFRTCARCGQPATVVNHKIPHKGDRKLFWSRSNWEAVCTPCHNGPIQSEERRSIKIFDRFSECSLAFQHRALHATELQGGQILNSVCRDRGTWRGGSLGVGLHRTLDLLHSGSSESLKARADKSAGHQKSPGEDCGLCNRCCVEIGDPSNKAAAVDTYAKQQEQPSNHPDNQSKRSK